MPNGLKAQVHPIGGKMLRPFLTNETTDVMVNYVYAYLKAKPKTKKNIRDALLLAQTSIVNHVRKGQIDKK